VARIDYDRVAATYDAARGLERDGLTWWRDAIEPYVARNPSLPVLDVGSGTGLWAAAFADWFGAQVIALEPSAGMLTQARAGRANPRIHYVSGVAEHLPLRDASCGLAWLSTVIHHFSDLDAAAREAARVVAPGGAVLIRSAFPGRTGRITLFRYFPEGAAVVETYPSVEDVVEAFERAGFRFEVLTSVPQVSARDLTVFRGRVALRADTTLLGIPDAAFERGLQAIDDEIATNGPGGPVIDYLDLLVLRTGGAEDAGEPPINKLLAQADALREQLEKRQATRALPSLTSKPGDGSAR